jgi:hypothetical protein
MSFIGTSLSKRDRTRSLVTGSRRFTVIRLSLKDVDRGAMCIFETFHLTFNFKSKVSRGIFKNENECQLTSTFSSKMSPQCHKRNNMCQFNLSSVNWCVVFFPSQVTPHVKNLNCARVDWRAISFCASFCVSNVENLQNFVKNAHCLIWRAEFGKFLKP